MPEFSSPDLAIFCSDLHQKIVDKRQVWRRYAAAPNLFHATHQRFEKLVDKNHQLENDLITMNKKYEDAVNDCFKAKQLIKSLEKHKTEVEIKVEEARNTNEKLLLTEIEQLKIALAERDDEISHLNKANISTKEALEKLNKALHENSKKFKEEKAKLYKENRAELKSWKKHFGEANSQILKLEKKIKVLEDTRAHEHELSVTQPFVSQPLFPTQGQADPSPIHHLLPNLVYLLVPHHPAHHHHQTMPVIILLLVQQLLAQVDHPYQNQVHQ